MKTGVIAGFKNAAVQAVLGHEPDYPITVRSAALVRVGKFLFGDETGLAKEGKPILLPDSVFYEVEDRKTSQLNVNDPSCPSLQTRILHNMIRAQMVVAERTKVHFAIAGLMCLAGIALHFVH